MKPSPLRPPSVDQGVLDTQAANGLGDPGKPVGELRAVTALDLRLGHPITDPRQQHRRLQVARRLMHFSIIPLPAPAPRSVVVIVVFAALVVEVGLDDVA